MCNEYPNATTEEYVGHELAATIRAVFPAVLLNALGPDRGALTAKASAGLDRWTKAPWAAVFEPMITVGAQQGYYPVYLFDLSRRKIYLSLNQGATAIRTHFGRNAGEVLEERAQLMRRRLPEFLGALPLADIERLDGQFGKEYARGHALGVCYDFGVLPDETVLVQDLRTIVRAYRALIFRGGLDFNADEPAAAQEDEPLDVEERKRYRQHRRIERNNRSSSLAKAHHGYDCQACDLNFVDRYGPLGQEFIEAHHLLPLADLDEGAVVDYCIATDFAVLCSNCHRMAHRLDDPGDIEALRLILADNE